MSNKNILLRILFPFVLLFLMGYFLLQSASVNTPERDVYFEYSSKCNLWEVRDMETGVLKSRITEGLKQLYELSGTRYAPLIKIDDKIVGHDMDRNFDWSKPFVYQFIDGEEAAKIYGKDAKYGLAEFSYSTGVQSEFSACTTEDETDLVSGLPLVLYEGTLSKRPSSIVKEREYNGLHILTGLAATEAYGERAASRPVFNHYKTDAVSEKRENDKTLRITNGTKGKIVIDYTSDREGEIDVLINQEYEQFVTTRHNKTEKNIRIELDPADWPPYNFTISVYKAGTDFGIDSRIHRLTNGKIEIDYITEDNIKRKFASEIEIGDDGNKVNYVLIPGEQLRLPEGFYKQINYVINSNLFKVADGEFISYWHQNLRNKYEQIEYQRYVTTRFQEEAEDLGFTITHDNNSSEFSVTSQNKGIRNIEILSWMQQQRIPAAIKSIAIDRWEEDELPMIIHNNDEINHGELLEILNQTPLQISRFIEIEEELAIKRFGSKAKNGVLVFKGIKTTE